MTEESDSKESTISNSMEQEIDKKNNDEKSLFNDENSSNSFIFANKDKKIESESEVEEEVEETQPEPEQPDDEEEEEVIKEPNELQNWNEMHGNLLKDLNYSVILAFFEKFSQHLQLKEITYKSFESNLINRKTLSRKLLDFHMSLLKKIPIGKNAKKEKWEYYLTRFAYKYSSEDGQSLEQNGYLNTDLHSKIRILKNLLEAQLDDNVKLKQTLSELDLTTLRSLPLGKDKDANSYWLFMDKEFTVRIYNQQVNDVDAKSWQLLAKDVTQFRELYDKLSKDPCLDKFRDKKEKLEKEEIVDEKPEGNLVKDIKLEEEKNVQSEKIKKEEIKTEMKLENPEKSPVQQVKSESENDIKQEENAGDVDVKKEEDVAEEEEQTNVELKNEILVDDLVDDSNDSYKPIALRKSKRSSVKKQLETSSTNSIIDTAVKKSKSPVKKKTVSSKKKSLNRSDDDSNEFNSDDSDDEPLINLKNKTAKRCKKSDDCDDDFEIASSKKGKYKNKLNDTDDESDFDVETACLKCNKVKLNQLLILCDGCDDSYHLTCCNPVLFEVPDGNWYCAICEHRSLCKHLEEKLNVAEKHFQQLELAKSQSIMKRTNRIADIGANLDNLFSKKSKSKPSSPLKPKRKPKNDDDDEYESDIENKRKRNYRNEKPILNNVPLGPRSCRAKTRINYTFEEFDRTIKEATKLVDENGQVQELDEDEEDEEEKRLEMEKQMRRKRKRINSSDDASSNSEYVADETRGKKKGSDDDFYCDESFDEEEIVDEEEEEEDDEEEEENDDEDFQVSPKKHRKLTSKRSNKKKKKANSYKDDDDNDDLAHVYDRYIERRSTRSSRQRVQTYCEISDNEVENRSKKAEQKQTRKKNKNDDDEDEFSLNESDDSEKMKNSNAKTTTTKSTSRIKKPWNSEDELKSDDETNSEAEETNKTTKTIEKKKMKESKIKKPWLSDDEEQEDEEEEENVKNKKKKKSIIKEPWANDDDDEDEEEEEDDNDDDNDDGEEETSKTKLNIKSKLKSTKDKDDTEEYSEEDPEENIAPIKSALPEVAQINSNSKTEILQPLNDSKLLPATTTSFINSESQYINTTNTLNPIISSSSSSFPIANIISDSNSLINPTTLQPPLVISSVQQQQALNNNNNNSFNFYPTSNSNQIMPQYIQTAPNVTLFQTQHAPQQQQIIQQPIMNNLMPTMNNYYVPDSYVPTPSMYYYYPQQQQPHPLNTTQTQLIHHQPQTFNNPYQFSSSNVNLFPNNYQYLPNTLNNGVMQQLTPTTTTATASNQIIHQYHQNDKI